jgi:hypothetical protein
MGDQLGRHGKLISVRKTNGRRTRKNERKEITEHLAEVVPSQRRSTPARDSALLAGAVAVAAA